MKQLTEVENLFVRACKKDNTRNTMYRIYERFYLGRGTCEPDKIKALATLLSDIVDKLPNETKMSDFLREYDNTRNYYAVFGEKPSHYEVVVDTLASKIRMSNKDDLLPIGYVSPLRWRVKHG